MPNINPIQLDLRATEPVPFIIPRAFRTALIQVSFKIELLEKLWQHVSLHTVVLAGKDLFPQKLPEPTNLLLGSAASLEGANAYFASHVSRVRNGAESEKPTKVKLTITVQSGEAIINRFECESDNGNPSDFYSLIQFKNAR